jgi:hypothetical protein
MSFLFFLFRKVNKASLTLCTLRKKKNKNDIIHEKLRVPISVIFSLPSTQYGAGSKNRFAPAAVTE